MSEPGSNRSRWVLWLVAAGVGGVWGGYSNLVAIAASEMVACVGVPGEFWGGDVGQAVLVVPIFLVIAAISTAMLSRKDREVDERLLWRLGILVSSLTATMFGYLGFYLIFNAIFGTILIDHIRILTMTFASVLSLFVVPYLSARLVDRRQFGD